MNFIQIGILWSAQHFASVPVTAVHLILQSIHHAMTAVRRCERVTNLPISQSLSRCHLCFFVHFQNEFARFFFAF